MKKWQIIDEDLAHCAKCGQIFTHIELYAGYCQACRIEVNEEAKEKTEIANSRVTSKGITKAAASLMSKMAEQGKSGQRSPVVLDEFFRAVGGEKKFAALMHTEFEKAHGIGVSEAEAEAWGPSSPKLRLHWYELIARMMDKTDQNKTLDISSLQEADLEAILADLGAKMVLEDKGIQEAAMNIAITNKTFRRKMFMEIARIDKELVDEFLASAGIITVEEEKQEDDTVSRYNPADSEYKEQ